MSECMTVSYGINVIGLFLMLKFMTESGEKTWHIVFGRVFNGSDCLQSLNMIEDWDWDIFKQLYRKVIE